MGVLNFRQEITRKGEQGEEVDVIEDNLVTYGVQCGEGDEVVIEVRILRNSNIWFPIKYIDKTSPREVIGKIRCVTGIRVNVIEKKSRKITFEALSV